MKRNVICFGEVLWDLLPQGPRIGGAPLNVCYHLHQHGIQSDIISQVGNDSRGQSLLAEIRNLQLDPQYCQLLDTYPTSVVEVSLDTDGKASYDIVSDVAWEYMAFDAQLAAAIGVSDAFVFGSLIARQAISFAVLKKYLAFSKYAVFDINLRTPHYERDVVFQLLDRCQLLKINDEEIEILCNWLDANAKDEKDLIKLICSNFKNIEAILLTKGADGALYYDRTDFYEVAAHKVTVNDTIGSGDSFLAAFLSNKLNGFSISESLEYASLLSAFVATQAGACPAYTAPDLLEFKNRFS